MTRAQELIGVSQPPLTEATPARADAHEIDHVGIAVEDLDAAVERYRRTFGVEPSHRERVGRQGVEEVLFDVGGVLHPAARRARPGHARGPVPRAAGPGIHHVAYRVDDIAAALERLRAGGRSA